MNDLCPRGRPTISEATSEEAEIEGLRELLGALGNLPTEIFGLGVLR